MMGRAINAEVRRAEVADWGQQWIQAAWSAGLKCECDHQHVGAIGSKVPFTILVEYTSDCPIHWVMT